MVTFCTVKFIENKFMADSVAAFVKGGGKIHEVATGVSGDNKHPFATDSQFSDKVKSSTSRGGKNAAVSKRK